MQDGAYAAFRGLYLSTTTGYVTSVTGPKYAMSGNKVVVAVMVHNISASATLTVYLDESIDGLAWKNSTSANATAFGHSTFSQASFDKPYFRIRVGLAGTDVNALCDVTVGLSAQ